MGEVVVGLANRDRWTRCRQVDRQVGRYMETQQIDSLGGQGGQMDKCFFNGQIGEKKKKQDPTTNAYIRSNNLDGLEVHPN